MVKYQLLSAYFLQSQIAEMAQMDCAGGEMTWGQTISSVRVMNGLRGENSWALQFGKTKDWCPGVGNKIYGPLSR